MRDHASRPRRSPRSISPHEALAIVELRRRRLTQARIAQAVEVPKSTVGRVLKRAGLSRPSDLDFAEPIVRYEHEHPGDILHIDTKKLGRIERMGKRIPGSSHAPIKAGWEYLFVAIDDHARIGFTDIYPDESKASAAQFAQNTVAYFRSLGVRPRRFPPTTARHSDRNLSPTRVTTRGSHTATPVPTGRTPTARPCVSFNRRYANGRTASLTTIPRSALPCWTVGCITTTGIVRITASRASHRSCGSPSPRTTC